MNRTAIFVVLGFSGLILLAAATVWIPAGGDRAEPESGGSAAVGGSAAAGAAAGAAGGGVGEAQSTVPAAGSAA
ncbi:MAG: hypothetical protein ACKPJD_22525, partial [Planctomycetaceae bacterium]